MAVIGFIGWKSLRFRRVKMKIPELLKQGALIIDVRSREEFIMGANPLSKNIPLGDIVKRKKELNKDKTLILCCASGARSGMAISMLRANGFTNLVNGGPWQNTLG